MEVATKLLNFIENSQIEFIPGSKDSAFHGLWYSEITNIRNSLFFGKKGESSKDINCFVTVMIHNLLAEMYLEHRNLTQIPPVLDISLKGINTFQDGYGFHFFPRLVENGNQIHEGRKNLQNNNRRPSHFNYRSGFIKAGFNIYNDSDDTALAYYSNFLSSRIHPESPLLVDFEPEQLARYLGQYRDTLGSGTNMWNWLRGSRSHTGAFLTWLPDLSEVKDHPFFPRKKMKYIPFGINDIDCVLNSNIIGVLRAMGVSETESLMLAEDWILSMVSFPDCRKCAVYYPTGYALYYSIVRAYCRGAVRLESALPEIVDHLLSTQTPEGFWRDRMKGNEIQTTLHAVSALVKIRKYTDDKYLRTGFDESINKGMDYLLSKLNHQDSVSWLDGGVVFSAGSIFKRKHVWKSDVWATALLLEILMNYE
jgi:hypothetical protein